MAYSVSGQSERSAGSEERSPATLSQKKSIVKTLAHSMRCRIAPRNDTTLVKARRPIEVDLEILAAESKGRAAVAKKDREDVFDAELMAIEVG